MLLALAPIIVAFSNSTLNSGDFIKLDPDIVAYTHTSQVVSLFKGSLCERLIFSIKKEVNIFLNKFTSDNVYL